MLEFDDLGLGIASHSNNLGLILCFHVLCFNNKGKQSKLEIISPPSNVSVIELELRRRLVSPQRLFLTFFMHSKSTRSRPSGTFFDAFITTQKI